MEQSSEYWLDIVKQATSSDMSENAWCKANEMSLSTYRYHKRQLIEKGLIDPVNPVVESGLTKGQETWLQRIKECCESNYSIDEWCSRSSVSSGTYKYYVRLFNRMGVEIPKKQHVSESNPVKNTAVLKLTESQQEYWEYLKDCAEQCASVSKWCKNNGVNSTNMYYYINFFKQKLGLSSLKELLECVKQFDEGSIVVSETEEREVEAASCVNEKEEEVEAVSHVDEKVINQQTSYGSLKLVVDGIEVVVDDNTPDALLQRVVNLIRRCKNEGIV